MTLQVVRVLDPIAPSEQAPEYVYEDADLGGESWSYRLFWNDRAARWQLDVWSEDGRKIMGQRLVPNYLLHWAHTGRRPSNGYMLLLDTGDPDARDACTYDGLGHRWLLCWLEDDGESTESDRPWSITVP